MKLSARSIWGFLSAGGSEAGWDSYLAWVKEDEGHREERLNKLQFVELCHCDLRPILADWECSEHHLGGNDLVGIADEVVDTISGGYKIATWYGPNAEVLIVGYQPDEISIV